MKRWLVRIVLGIVALAVLAGVSALLVRFAIQQQIAHETRIDAPNGIDSLETITLGGREQSILIRGHDRSKPVLLFLHGGPGSPVMHKARVFSGELEKHFVVVHWDQRGAGKSYRTDIPASEMTIAQFERDSIELINSLRQRFDAERIYLVGHSWGSILGARVAAKHPEMLWAYVGAGQPVDTRRAEQISYDYVVAEAKKAGDQEALTKLAGITPPYETIDGLITQRHLLWKFLRHDQPKDAPKPVKTDLTTILTLPEYSLLDAWRLREGTFWTIRVMWKELVTVNLVEQVPCIDVPVYLFTGRYDFQVPFSLSEEWLEKLTAPAKTMIWFEHSGHEMYLDEPALFQEKLIREVLPNTYGKTFSKVCKAASAA